MFIVVLFVVVKNWKQPTFPSKGEWIDKFWCIHTMEYYTPIKKNGLLINPTTFTITK